MFTRISLCLAVIFLASLAFAQGSRYENHPAMKQRADGALIPTSAQIAVCTQPATTNTTPCSPLATLYTDATLATPCTGTLKDGTVAGATNCSNPLITDSKGNYHFYAAGGPFTIQVSGSGLTTTNEPDITLPGAYVPLAGPGGPWLDVTSPTFGASTCTGSGHDDTPAFLAAATAANGVGGGTVLVPYTSTGCFWNTALVITGFTNVRFKGTGGPQWSGTSLAPKITCAVTGAGNCLTALNTVAVEMDHLNIIYNQNTFTGSVLNFGNNGSLPSQGTYLHDMAVQGTATATTATYLVNLSGSPFGDDEVKIDNVNFHNAVNAINGQSTFVVRLSNSDFSTATGDISGSFIKNIGSSWTVIGNGFELGNAAGNVSIVDCTSACGSNDTFISNWTGDTPANFSGTLFKAMATGGGSNYSFYGNQFLGGSSLLAKFFQNAAGSAGLNVMANQISNFGTAFQIDAAITDVNISSNFFGTVTNFLAGAVGIFNSGYQFDNAGNMKLIGPVLINNAISPVTAGGIDAGTSALPFSGIRIGNAATNNIRITGTATAARTATLQDATGTIGFTSGSSISPYICSGTATASQTMFLSTGAGTTTCTDTAGTIAKIMVPSAGTITNLRCAAGTGGVNASSGVVTVRKTGADQAVTCTFGTGTTCSDTNQAHNFAVAAGDSLAIKYTTQAAETLANINCSVEKF